MSIKEKNIFSFIFSILLIVTVFADGSNLDDYIKDNLVIHDDMPLSQEYCNYQILNNKITKDIIPNFKSTKSNNKHLSFDQDSPSFPVDLIDINVGNFKSDFNQKLKYIFLQFSYPLYILYCSLLI